MKITVHRGSNQVGATCIEVSSGPSNILLDFGLPLPSDSEFASELESSPPEPLFSQLTNRSKKIHGLFLSHAHLDHYGLVGKLPSEIPIYCSPSTKILMEFTDEFTPNKIGTANLSKFQSYHIIKMRDLLVTPYLMDHSAFDSHGFLVQAENKSIFYTGDFRGHGLKGELFEELAERLPQIDILIMEGTIIGEREEELFKTEEEIEEELVNLCDQVVGPVLVSVPSQNNRVITIFKAAKRSQRKLLIDLYSAELFKRLEKVSDELPQSGSNNVAVWYPYVQRELQFGEKSYQVMGKHKKWKQTLTELSPLSSNLMIFFRPPFREEIENHFDLSNSFWVYSMWPGYLKRNEPLRRLRKWAKKRGIDFKILHTSGHAKLPDLKRFADALAPQKLVPIHSFHPDQFAKHFKNVHVIKDGESLLI